MPPKRPHCNLFAVHQGGGSQVKLPSERYRAIPHGIAAMVASMAVEREGSISFIVPLCRSILEPSSGPLPEVVNIKLY